MLSRVAIQGDGVAATCCARLLEQRGLDVIFDAQRDRLTPRPTLLINPQTQTLLADVFGSDADLLSGAQPIRRRVVLWGADAGEPRSFPHSGLAIQESALLSRLWQKIHGGEPHPAEYDWQIISARCGPGRMQRHFGTRMAAATEVMLENAKDDACWIESLRDGWLFLVPIGTGKGSLIAVGSDRSALLTESQLVKSQIGEVIGEGVEFAAYPRIFTPLCDSGWLACGTAAMAFDPICGEGAGNSIREAILAAAVLGSIQNGADEGAVLGQYSMRLLAGFLRHLELCKQFYLSGGQGEWWDTEVKALDRGVEWTRAQLAAAPSPSSRLVGFDLVAV